MPVYKRAAELISVQRCPISTQNRAVNTSLFSYRHIPKKDFGEHRDTVRAKRSRQELPGHGDVRTTMIYAGMTLKEAKSPPDF